MDAEEQSTQNVRRMRSGIRAALLRVGVGIRQMSPFGLLALLSAGAFAPVLAAAGGVAGAVSVAGIGLLGSAGVNVLTDLLSQAIDHLRQRDDGREPAQDEIERELMARIEDALGASDTKAESLRVELGRVLREIGMSQTAVEAAIQSGNQELQSAVMECFANLSTDFAEFGFLLTDVRNVTVAIKESLRQQDIDHQADRQRLRQQSDQLRLMTDQLAVIDRRTRYLYGTVVFAGSNQQTAKAVKFEGRYRRGIRDLLDKVELFGLDLPDVPRSYRIGAAYVSLLLEQTGGRSSDLSQPLHLEDLLGSNQRILIEGAAGTGKSTVLRYLALRVLDGSLPGFDQENSSLIPFLLKLRSFVKEDVLRLPDPDDLIKEAAPLLKKEQPEGWVSGLLGEGRAIVLIDGIDEIREAHRPKALNWLQQLTVFYPEAFYLVTSRPAAMKEQWRAELRDLGFATAKLEPMTEIQVDDFIDRWYRAAAESGRSRYYRAPREAEAAARQLKHDLASRPDLHALAATPLLCAVICALNLGTSHLPTGRAELYREALYLLLERRDVQRSIRGYRQLLFEQSLLMLGRVALWMLMNGQDFVPRPSALTAIAELADRFGESADYMLQQLLEQTGLLQWAKEGIEFRYSSFKDYLAASEIIRQDLFQFLIINSHNPTYHDVVVNAMELASFHAKRQLLVGLIARAEQAGTKTSEGRQLWLLAADCLNHSDAAQVDLADRIRNEVERLEARVESD